MRFFRPATMVRQSPILLARPIVPPRCLWIPPQPMGAAAGSLIVLGRGAHRRRWLLLIEALLLAGAALCHSFGHSDTAAAVAAIVLPWTGECGAAGFALILSAIIAATIHL